MRVMSVIIVAALLVGGCSASVGSVPPGPERPSKWEYKQDRICVASHLPPLEHDAQLVSVLEQRGREGWELVSVSPTVSGSETCYLLIFKRASAER